MTDSERQEVAAACRNAQIELEDMREKITDMIGNAGDGGAQADRSEIVRIAIVHIKAACVSLKSAADYLATASYLLYEDDAVAQELSPLDRMSADWERKHPNGIKFEE